MTNKDREWKNRGQTLAIDFDGVLHRYSKGWQGGKIYDTAVEGAQTALKKLIDRGYQIVIYTTRAETEDDIEEIREWLRLEGFVCWNCEITNRKPPAIAYIDDRAVRFTNWADMAKLWA